MKNNSTFNKEQWKYTNINLFKNYSYNYIYDEVSSKTNKDIIQIINGRLKSKIYSNKKIIIESLKNILNKNPYNTKDKIDLINKNSANPFIKLNSKYYKDGVYIYIKDNTTIDKPVKIKNSVSLNRKKSFLNERILLVVGNNVSAKIFFEENLPNICSLNTVFQIFIGKNSNIDFIHNSQKTKTTQIYNLSANINSSSKLNIFPIDISGELIKKHYFIKLEESNSECNINALNMLNNNDHIDNYIQIEHCNNHTTSSTNQKNILSGNSTCVFYAKAIIHKKSHDSEANQKNNNLILSNKATIHSNPQLEIYNNDVKCSHGSTTGELDNEVLFYMQSRGLKFSKCKQLILNGFANEIIDNLTNEEIKTVLKQKITSWLLNVN